MRELFADGVDVVAVLAIVIDHLSLETAKMGGQLGDLVVETHRSPNLPVVAAVVTCYVTLVPDGHQPVSGSS
jgi:hypothetical protein